MNEVMKRIEKLSHEDGDCRIWDGCVSGNGTPKMSAFKQKNLTVRRVVAELHGHKIAGKIVTNTCGNRLCVAPEHVLVVNHSQQGKLNAERAGFASKISRRAKISASARKRAKLTLEAVEDIRYGPGTVEEKCARYGIAKATAMSIRAYKTWQDYSSPWAGMGAR